MIDTKHFYNYRIDWHSAGINHEDKLAPIVDTLQRRQKIIEDRKHYFDMLHRFLSEIDVLIDNAKKEDGNILPEKLEAIFKRYNVHFVDIDDIKRVNLDDPKG
jgi:hypothetical protein